MVATFSSTKIRGRRNNAGSANQICCTFRLRRLDARPASCDPADDRNLDIGRTQDDHHRRRRGPSSAPMKAHTATIAPYQTAIKGMESSGQWNA